jgi:hypothetical protein
MKVNEDKTSHDGSSESPRPALLGCPFCGETPAIEPWHAGALTKVMISCENDDCDIAPQVTDDVPDIAEMKWNTHANMPEQNAQAVLDAIRTKLREWAGDDNASPAETLVSIINLAAGRDGNGNEIESETCKWTFDSVEWEANKWDSDCGESYYFVDGGPDENKMKFCCYCGKSLIETVLNSPNE